MVITGAAGFIGSCLLSALNKQGVEDLLLVDDFARQDKMKNLEGKACAGRVHRDDFPGWLDRNHGKVSQIVHLGARTDTTEWRQSIFDRLNLGYSRSLWKLCARYGIPLLYASSAATYGSGNEGYSDHHGLLQSLKPLNAYGRSKHDFDLWALAQPVTPPHWAGLKFFNVYGPNEYHKGRMASVVYHLFRQIRQTGEVRLFRSHRADVPDGEQRRDFIYVRDVVEACLFFLRDRPPNGVYNLGTGLARSYNDLARATFVAMGVEARIHYVDTPESIRDNYQYFTRADISKLRAAGYDKPFSSLEEGVGDYVTNYLAPGEVCF